MLLVGACLTLRCCSLRLVELDRVLTDDLASPLRVFVLLRVSVRAGDFTELRELSFFLRTSEAALLLFTSVVLELRVCRDVVLGCLEGLATVLLERARIAAGDGRL